MRAIYAVVFMAASLFGLSLLPSEAELEQQLADEAWSYRAEVVATWNTTTTTIPATTTSTTVLADTATRREAKRPPVTTAMSPIDVVCGQWSEVALSMGWEPHHLETLGAIAYRESRCQHWQHRTDTDGTVCSGDYGLLQLNWTAWGALIEERLGYTCDDLLIPAVNLLVAKQIVYDEAIKAGYGCGFRPWYMTGDYCP